MIRLVRRFVSRRASQPSVSAGCEFLRATSSARYWVQGVPVENCGSGLGVDGFQNPHPIGVGKSGFTQIERQFLLRNRRSLLFPQAAKFGRPWSGDAPFQLDHDRFRVFFNCDSEHLLALLRHASDKARRVPNSDVGQRYRARIERKARYFFAGCGCGGEEDRSDDEVTKTILRRGDDGKSRRRFAWHARTYI